jgi:hypothetical protein
MLAVAEMIVELVIERRFDHHLRQLRQQPTLTGEPQPLGAGPLSQLPHQLVAGHTRLRLRRIQVTAAFSSLITSVTGVSFFLRSYTEKFIVPPGPVNLNSTNRR